MIESEYLYDWKQLYAAPWGDIKIEVIFDGETFWLSQRKMAELFGKDIRTINEHLLNIFNEGELDATATIRKFRIVQTEGSREVSREVEFYNLDAIIAVGYRVNSYQATQFRIWATRTLKEFIIKGFVLDDERLKQGRARTTSMSCSNVSARYAPASGVFIKKSPTSMPNAAWTTTRSRTSRRSFTRLCRTDWSGPHH